MPDLRRLAPLTISICASASFAAAQNNPPNAPTITEPATVGQQVSPFDVHLETAPFMDVDAGDTHAGTDWEIWSFAPLERVWAALNVTGFESVHAHLSDGVFENSLAGADSLGPSTAYSLRVRHKDSSGDPATEWSPFSQRIFTTGSATSNIPLELDDVASSPEPRWIDSTGADMDLGGGAPAPSLRLDNHSGNLFIRFDGQAGPGYQITNPGPLSHHDPVRVVIEAGGQPLSLPESTLTVIESGCEAATIFLPSISLQAGQDAYFWVGAQGNTFIGDASQSQPDFSNPAQSADVPWVVNEPGYEIDVVAENLQLPINIAFVPNPGPNPGDPKFYVTELYGAIKVVTNDGTMSNYATGLVDFTPTGAFPGSGEQGLTGIAVDPVSGDVFASLLRDEPGPSNDHEPRIIRLSSNDGGLTAANETTILYMAGENQGQSHQISNLEIIDGKLYCHMGDGFNASTSRNFSSYRGKILRMNLDGSPDTSNPFYNPSTINSRDYIYCLGVRNPFGGAWRAADNSRYFVENGPSVDRFAKAVAGRDYLWSGSDSHMFNFALYNWQPATGPVNIEFIQPETFGGSGFPPEKFDRAFVTESGPTYANGQQANGKRITEWELDASGALVSGPTTFLEYTGTGRATVCGLAAGPDGLYFTELYKDQNTTGPTAVGARVIRVRYSPSTSDDCNGSGTPDWCEIATGMVHDLDGNGLPDECDPLAADTDVITLSTGGSVQFTIDADAGFAGKTYWLLGSSSGTMPGIALGGGLTLPLNPGSAAVDPWLNLTMLNPNTAILMNTLGPLDANGDGSATLTLPLGTPLALAGLSIHHAYVVYDPAVGFVYASNAVPLQLTL